MQSGSTTLTQRAWSLAGTLAVLAIVMLVGAEHLEAQATSWPPNFHGSWNIMGRDFDQAEACGHLTNTVGNPVIRCSIPYTDLEPYLSPRALALTEIFRRDEYLSPKWHCKPPTIPAALDGMIHTFRFVSESELEIIQSYYWHTRHIWMDGREAPNPRDSWFTGYSRGHFEGENEIVIETTNFTFDVDGIDDHLHIPSSDMKKVTERYTLLDEDTMRITITLEDPLMLVRPFTWSHMMTRDADHVPMGVYNCDPEYNLFEVEGTVPDPYGADISVNR
jgi:hypothetical protein